MAEINPLARRILKVALWSISLLVVGYLVLIGFFMFGPTIYSYATQTGFDSVRWKASLESNEPIKQQMVSSLYANHSLIGQSKEQVNQLLGTPPATNYFKEYE